MKFAFISRHEITDRQQSMAAEQDVEIIPIGDVDAFEVTPDLVKAAGEFDGVVVVHPAAAMRLASTYKIGVFENRLRVKSGLPVIFEEKSFHIYDLKTKTNVFSPGMV